MATRYRNDRERIERNIQVDPDGCWVWRRALSSGGYGLVGIGNRTVRAHRLAYELFVGPIPVGLELDHLCRVRRCVNPVHLEPVTRLENVHRSPIQLAALNAGKRACLKGHAYDADNTHVGPDGKRRCRTCRQNRPRGPRSERS